MGLFMQPLKIKLHHNIAVTSGQKELTVATNIIHVELHKASRPSSFYWCSAKVGDRLANIGTAWDNYKHILNPGKFPGQHTKKWQAIWRSLVTVVRRQQSISTSFYKISCLRAIVQLCASLGKTFKIFQNPWYGSQVSSAQAQSGWLICQKQRVRGALHIFTHHENLYPRDHPCSCHHSTSAVRQQCICRPAGQRRMVLLSLI